MRAIRMQATREQAGSGDPRVASGTQRPLHTIPLNYAARDRQRPHHQAADISQFNDLQHTSAYPHRSTPAQRSFR
jgi:hypothetical protein